MPLTNEQKVDMLKAGAQDEIRRVNKYLGLLGDMAPQPGSLEGRDFVTALGVFWYMVQGGLRKRLGENEVIRADINANLIAGLLTPDLVDLMAAVERALDYRRMAAPAAKG